MNKCPECGLNREEAVPKDPQPMETMSQETPKTPEAWYKQAAKEMDDQTNMEITEIELHQKTEELRIAATTIEQLKSERENWRMSSVNRELAEQLRIAEEALRDIAASDGQWQHIIITVRYTLRKLEEMRAQSR